MGFSTAATIWGERLAPKLVDLYLGRKGVQSQQSSKEAPRWGANLDQPADAEADRGARGAFDSMAHGSDPVLWMSQHRRSLLCGLGAAAGLGLAASLARAALR